MYRWSGVEMQATGSLLIIVNELTHTRNMQEPFQM